MSLDTQLELRITPEKIGEGFELAEKTKVEAGRKIAPETQLSAPPKISPIDEGVGEPGIDSSRAPLHQAVENILEQDLEEIYFSMDENTQKIFKQKGEQVAGEIIKLIQTAKATFKKVFQLIISWLKIIPGVNKFFLEQAAKIKADKILRIDW